MNETFQSTRRDEVTASLQANLRQQLTESFMHLQNLTPEQKPFSATDFVKDVGAYIGGDKDKLRIVPKEQENYFDLLTNVVMMTTMLFWSSTSLGWLPYYDFNSKSTHSSSGTDKQEVCACVLRFLQTDTMRPFAGRNMFCLRSTTCIQH